MPALNTDLYQLTMAAGYFAAGKAADIATFELTVRRLPAHRNFLVSAGLEQAIDYLRQFRFDAAELAYLQSLKQFANAPSEFFAYLAGLRFTGDIFAMPEGTPVFPGEPILIVRAPLIQAQLVETSLLSTIAYQTIVASKAARCTIAAQGRAVVEFGSRRAHSREAGPLAGRAAYLAGCAGTSNAQAGMLYGVPVFGTAAHSWTMAFPDEALAFQKLHDLLGEDTVYLLDTYDTAEAAKLAMSIGPPMWGVRLDSGDLVAETRKVRRILDDGGFPEAKIMITNDLNESRIAELLACGARIDAFGVGTELATSADAPALSAVYKLVELRSGESNVYTAKYSADKVTLPAAKQVYRYPDRDVVALYAECSSEFQGEPLLRPALANGELVEPLPALTESRARAVAAVSHLPADLRQLNVAAHRRVETSDRLLALADCVRASHQVAVS